MLAKQHKGVLTPEIIVQAAQNEDNPLHNQFDWNDSSAAHKHRLDIARQLLRAVRFEVRTTKHVFNAVPSYIHNPSADYFEQSYINIETTDRETKREVLLDEVERVISMILRAQKISAATMPTIVEDWELVLNSVIAIKAKIKREAAAKRAK